MTSPPYRGPPATVQAALLVRAAGDDYPLPLNG